MTEDKTVIPLVSKVTRTVAALLALVVLATVEAQEPAPPRLPRETLAHYAARILPPGSELAHTPLEGRFGPGARNTLILFRATNDVNTNFSGWVMVPGTSGAPAKLTRHTLPAMREIPGHFEIAVEAVFYANADSDPAPELFVIYSYHRNGSQDDDARATAVYDWDGHGFLSLEPLEEQIAGFKTVAAIRAKLARQTRVRR